MSESIEKATQTQLGNIEKSTGKKLGEWNVIINNTGLSKHGELVSFLKKDHGFTYGNANALVHYAKQSLAPSAEEEIDWVKEQYKGKENLIAMV